MIEALVPTANARVSLREITVDTVNQVIQLSDTLTEGQQKLLASNAVSIAQAHFLPKAWPRAIFANETLVGFLMLHDNSDSGDYFLWRLMIARSHQRKGFGRRAIELLVDYIKTRPNAVYLCASYVPLDKGLDVFYEKLGFASTGDAGHGERAIRLAL